MIEVGSSEEIKFAVLSAMSWMPDEDDVAKAANALIQEGAKIVWGDITNTLVAYTRPKKQLVSADALSSQYVVICFWFRKVMEATRERDLTIRAAKAARMYPYQFMRVPVEQAGKRWHKNLPDPKVDSRSTVLQVWLSEHLCR